MTNPIDNGSSVNRSRVAGTQARRTTEESRTAESPEATREPGVGSDEASESSRLQAVRKTIDNTPTVDGKRVEEIKQRLANGDYPLDPQRVANRFANFEKLLNS